MYDYDLFVIGAGSGGVRAARLAAGRGGKVGIAEADRFGGTCVIRGCVPKKLYVYASQFSEHFADAAGYGWTVADISFDWRKLVANKSREVARLEHLYRQGVSRAGADIFDSRAVLVDDHTVSLTAIGRTVTARNILIATGGQPDRKTWMRGHGHCITSDEFFDLPQLPRTAVIEGGGYIAVELATMLHGLGVETTLVYRGKEILRRFDLDLRRTLHETMERKGIRILCGVTGTGVAKLSGGRLRMELSNDTAIIADQILVAIGRRPNTDSLGLEAAGVKCGPSGEIIVDRYLRTSRANIFAIGDVTGRIQLTPVAIHEAICVVETLFKANPTAPDHGCVPTAVFSQPEIGTVGLSEDDAAAGFEELEIYRTSFRPMRNILAARDERMLIKLVVDSRTRKVLGVHMLGPDAGEFAQLVGLALKAGLTKDDFDATMAVHPTAMEELVTMYRPSYEVKHGRKVE